MRKRVLAFLLASFALLFMGLGCYADWITNGDSFSLNNGDTLAGGKMYTISCDATYQTISFSSTSEYGITVTLQIDSGDNYYSGMVYLPNNDSLYTVSCGQPITVREMRYNVPDTTAVYDEGYNAGYETGHNEGYNTGYSNGYNVGKSDGITEGQNLDEVVESGLNGFFNGLSVFVSSFTSLGIGTLTVGSVIALVLIVFLLTIILRIVRG